MSGFFRAGVLFAILSFPSAWADPAVDAAFSNFYFSDKLQPRFCGANVDWFIEHLRERGILPKDFARVVIRNENSRWHPAGMLIAVNSRSGRTNDGIEGFESWYFHVVGVHDGKVYDFSFDREPRAVPLEEYFEEMFVPTRPFMLFGPTFRIRGQGPHYGPTDAREELAGFEFEAVPAEKRRQEPEPSRYSGLEAFLDAFRR